ncbi:unnamed protein product [Ectocarpus sp. 12 AP-2014]
MHSFESFINQPVTYLASAKSKLLLIGFLMIFIVVFLVVYAPFNMDDWDKGLFFGYVFTGGLVLLMSQFVLRPLLGLQNLKVYSALLWCIFEVLLVPFGIYLFFSPSFPTLSEKLGEYYLTLTYTALVIPGPYLLFIWYLGLQHKVSSFAAVAVINTDNKKQNDLLTLTSENNKVILAIKYDQLLYIKSSGNYLEIFYLKGDKKVKELVRMSLKDMEARVTYPAILRVHRSYMVNKHHIASFKRTRKGYAVIVEHIADTVLPVSSGYKTHFEENLQLSVSH